MATRKNEIVNRLNKTKDERYPDLAMERHEYDQAIRDEKKQIYREEAGPYTSPLLSSTHASWDC